MRNRFGAASESGGSRMRPVMSSNCSLVKTGRGPGGAPGLPPGNVRTSGLIEQVDVVHIYEPHRDHGFRMWETHDLHS